MSDIVTNQIDTVPYYMTRYLYREFGKTTTFLAISKNNALTQKELASVSPYFQNTGTDGDWKKYLACLKQIPIFCDRLSDFCDNFSKNLDNREILQSRDGEAIGPEQKTETLEKFKHLEEVFRKLVQFGGLSAEEHQGYIDPNLLKKFHLEKEIEKNQILVTEIEHTVEMCQTKEITNCKINNAGNIRNLREFSTQIGVQTEKLQQELENIPENQILGPVPQILKQRWDRAKGDIHKTLNELTEFLKKNSTVSSNNFLFAQLSIITKAIVPALNSLLRLPTLEAVSEKKQIIKSNPFVKNCWQIASILGELNCELPEKGPLRSTLDEVYSEVKKLNLMDYSFAGSQEEINYDYEFRSNSWFYAYVRCLIEQNNCNNRQRVRNIYSRCSERYDEDFDHSLNTLDNEDFNEDENNEPAQLPETDHDDEYDADKYSHNSETMPGGVTDDGSADSSPQLSDENLIRGIQNTVEEAIVLLDKKYEKVKGTSYKILCSLGKRILNAILTPSSIEQNLFLTYLTKYPNYGRGALASTLENVLRSKAKSPLWASSFGAVVRSFQISNCMKQNGIIEVFKDNQKDLRLFKIKKESSEKSKIRVFSQGIKKRSFSVLSKEKIDALFSSINNASRELA